MSLDQPLRIVLAAGVLLIAIFAALIVGAPVLSAIAFFLGGLIVIVLLGVNAINPPAPIRRPPPQPPTANNGADIDSFVEAIGEPVLVVSEGRVMRANQAARKLLGTHIVGEDVRLAIRHPAAAERLASPAASVDANAIELVGVGGREQRWEMRVSPLAGGRRIVHLIDRTSSHAAEKMRVDFVANASHELRTPLAAILGFIETLADDKAGGDSEVRERFLKVMDGEARRMQRLVEDLMSLSRIEAEKYRVPDAAVDLSQLIDEVHGVLHDGPNKRGHDIVVALEDEVPFVAGDRIQLSQLMHNIVGNAMKYGRPGTPITIKLRRGQGTMVKLSVADEGEGIPAEHLPRLTERFYRVDSGRSRAMGGTGLGLAIVKHIVERHRGRLDIASTVGKGTTVTVALPAAPSPAKEMAGAGEQNGPLSSKVHGNETRGSRSADSRPA